MADTKKICDLLQENDISFVQDECLSKHCSFEIGGKACFYCTPNSIKELAKAIELFKQTNTIYFILGKGSNVLFSDEGFVGAVISTAKLNEVSFCEDIITAQTGAALSSVCTKAKNSCLAGLEFAFGIPGSVGGALYMNAGAYGGEMKDIVLSVQCIDEDGNIIILNADECNFGYRQSVFQQKKLCILSAQFKLQKNENNIAIGLKMSDYAKRRAEKQPLDMPSAGSAFKRPQGAFAGQLIDECNLRGYSVGGASISEKHCGFIVNKGNATCADVVNLAKEVCEKVKAQTGYDLEKEIRVISFNGEG